MDYNNHDSAFNGESASANKPLAPHRVEAFWRRIQPYVYELYPVLEPRPDGIPVTLKGVPQWTCWRLMNRYDKKAKKKVKTKVPIDVRTGQCARVDDPSTWASFDEAYYYYLTHKDDPGRTRVHGVGFMLTPELGFTAFDFDHCCDPIDRKLAPWAAAFVARLDTYFEQSVGRRGVRGFALGVKPGGRCRVGPAEVYSHARFLTISGHRLVGYPADLAACQEAIDWTYAELFKPEPLILPAAARPPVVAAPADDERVLRVARSSRKTGERFVKLFDLGDASAYPSPSEAVLALANDLAYFVGGPDVDRTARLLLASKLVAGNDKWAKRGEYLARRAAARAHKGRAKYYPWPGGSPAEAAMQQAAPPSSATATLKPLVSSAEFFATEYRLTYLIKRVLVKGQPMVVGAPKKSMKTWTSLDLAISLASGPPFLGHFEVLERCRVGFISGESGEATIKANARAICAAKGIAPLSLGIHWGFTVPRLSQADDRAWLCKQINDGGLGVIILDPLYLSLLAGSHGIDPANFFQMGPLLRDVAQVCLDAGATPVLVHHFNRARERGDPRAKYAKPGLEDLAYGGIGEFARQWLLLNHRERFHEGTGQHKLWLVVGGSAGHSSEWVYDADEGVPDENLAGKRWVVSVTPTEVAESAAATRAAGGDRGDEAKLLAALDRIDPDRNGATITALREEAGLNNTRAKSAVARLQKAKRLIPCKVKKLVGKGKSKLQEYDAIRRPESNHGSPGPAGPAGQSAVCPGGPGEPGQPPGPPGPGPIYSHSAPLGMGSPWG
jgi:replicative DNA helicase